MPGKSTVLCRHLLVSSCIIRFVETDLQRRTANCSRTTAVDMLLQWAGRKSQLSRMQPAEIRTCWYFSDTYSFMDVHVDPVSTVSWMPMLMICLFHGSPKIQLPLISTVHLFHHFLRCQLFAKNVGLLQRPSPALTRRHRVWARIKAATKFA